MTEAAPTAPDLSLRHLSKLEELREGCEPLYACQLCGRRGVLDQLNSEECPKRSGAIRKVAATAKTPSDGS